MHYDAGGLRYFFLNLQGRRRKHLDFYIAIMDLQLTEIAERERERYTWKWRKSPSPSLGHSKSTVCVVQYSTVQYESKVPLLASGPHNPTHVKRPRTQPRQKYSSILYFCYEDGATAAPAEGQMIA